MISGSQSFELFPHIPTQQPIPAVHPPNNNSQHLGKVFGIGYYKTGTTSLSEALTQLGFRTFSWKTDCPINMRMLSHRYNTLGYWFQKSLFPYQVGTVDISWLFVHPYLLDAVKYVSSRASNFADGPWLYIYRILDEWYPNSKFILTVRDSTYDYVNSEVRQVFRNSFKGKGEAFEAFLSEQIFGTRLSTQIGLWARGYEKHNENVMKYFSTSEAQRKKLLVINLSTEDDLLWEKLAEFLNCPVAKNRFPRLNSAPPWQNQIVLPKDYNLNWNQYHFPKEFQNLFELVNSYDPDHTDKRFFIQQLKGFYMPIKPAFMGYSGTHFEDYMI